MRRGTAFLTSTTVLATVLAFIFWNQLQKIESTAKLQQQGEKLAGTSNMNSIRPTTGDALPHPTAASVAPPTSLGAQAVPGDVGSHAQELPSGCEATLARAKQSAAVTIAQWAVDLQLTPDEIQRVTTARQAQVVARQPCASAGGSNVNPEQLQADFLAALGPARTEQLLELNASRLTHSNMSYLSNQLRERGIPLNEAQASQLATIFLEENRRSQRDAIRSNFPSDARAQLAFEEEILGLTEKRLERIRVAAQSFLRPEQLAKLAENAESEISIKRSNVKLTREAAEQGRKIQPPPLLFMIKAPQ